MPLPQLQTYPGIVTPKPADAMMQAMKMKDQLKRTGLQEQGLELRKDELGIRKETLEFNKKQKKLEAGKQFIPTLTKEDYPRFKNWIKGIDEDWADLLPDEPPEDFDAFKEQIYLGADNLTKSNLAQYKAMMDQVKSDKKDKAAMDRAKLAADARIKAANISASKKDDTSNTKELESLKSDYMAQVGRGYSAERGVGQFVEDPNKQVVAKKAYESAQIIAQQYVNSGGKWEDLGLEDPGKAPEAKEVDFAEQLTKTHPPAEYKGQSGTDTETGKKYKSDGKNWVEVKQ